LLQLEQMNRKLYINGSDTESDEEEEMYLDDNNPAFVDFKKNVKTWLELDDDIQTLNEALKARKKMKEEITPKLTEFMNSYQINDLNTKDGQLKFSKLNVAKPLSKKYLMNRVGDFFKSYSKGEEIVNFVYENRERQEKFKLRRVVNKKK
jgi:hypothetical protein